MKSDIRTSSMRIAVIGVSALLFMLPIVRAQQGTKDIEVANTRMGPFIALAELTMQQYRRGDYATASTLAKVLNRAWNNSEFNRKDGLSTTNYSLWKKIDQRMDAFWEPIAENKRPDVSTVQHTFDAYISELRAAN